MACVGSLIHIGILEILFSVAKSICLGCLSPVVLSVTEIRLVLSLERSSGRTHRPSRIVFRAAIHQSSVTAISLLLIRQVTLGNHFVLRVDAVF